jgi:signal peptidase II
MVTHPADSSPRWRLLPIFAPVLLTGILADQASKAWAASGAVQPRALVPGYLVAYAVPNTGIVTGLSRDNAQTVPASTLLSLACAAWLARVAYRDRKCWRWADWLACSLLLTGILGNVIDRVALGYVRDFLVTRALPTLVFNLADVLVVAGIAGLLLARSLGGLRAGRARVALG